jgi:GNAT superfamily N-acetyltransferase
MRSMNVTLREVEAEDAAAAAELSAQFGYPVEADEMRRRIAGLKPGVRAVFVACADGEVMGWIDVGAVSHLQSGTYAEIGGLVVAAARRSQGVGARLVEAAEGWAREHGLERMVVRSRTAREDAHRFYLREGYALTKTSVVFTKEMK